MDPREELVKLGNELLDATYRVDQDKEYRNLLKKAHADGDPEFSKAIIDENGGPERLIAALQRAVVIDSLRERYCQMRAIIEAMEASRTDDIMPGSINPERSRDA